MDPEVKFGLSLGAFPTIGLLGLIAVGLWGCPQYNVYSKQMRGQAAYGEALQNRKIKVLEAQASLDSAKLNSEAEVERAKGANEANRIMAESLGGAENYLRWSYINMLQETAGKGGQQTIYIPTEASIPILEAGKRGETK